MRYSLACLLSCALILSHGSALAEDPWSFVVIPDAMNNDVWLNDADWYGDNPDGSFNDGTYAAWPYALNAMASESPDFVLVAGDLVQGRWSLDKFSDNQIQNKIASDPANFGHLTGLSGVEARKEHVRFMADRTYPDWNQMWTNAGINNVISVPGDHEFGDNPWDESYDADVAPIYREKYEEYRPAPTGATVYDGSGGRTFEWTHKNLTLVGMDVFDMNESGNVSVGLNNDQLAFVEDVLAGSTSDHIFAMAHTPILPGSLKRSSSGIEYPDGQGSDLWQALSEGNVDVFLAGEVHDTSGKAADGVLQLVNGTQPSNVSEINYIVVTVHDDVLEFELKLLETTLDGPRSTSGDPYGVDPYLDRQVKLTQTQFDTGFVSAGTMTLDKSTGLTEYTDLTGYFADPSRFDYGSTIIASGNQISAMGVEGTLSDYEIVESGLMRGALAYTDRTLVWTGTGDADLPAYLEDAEFIRTANDDKTNSNLEITLVLEGEKQVYVMFDDRIGNKPDWLTEQFAELDDNLRLKLDDGTLGAGVFSVWLLTTEEGGTFVLGGTGASGNSVGMYGIAVVPEPSSLLLLGLSGTLLLRRRR